MAVARGLECERRRGAHGPVVLLGGVQLEDDDVPVVQRGVDAAVEYEDAEPVGLRLVPAA